MGKRFRWFGATFLVLEIFYLIAGNLFLRFGLVRLTNFAPETMEMEVEGPFTLWPGTAHVRHYRIRAQDHAIQWVLEVDDADLTVDLLDLFKRKFHATRVRARDCSFHLRRKLDDAGAASPRARALVPIPGFADPPMKEIGPPEAPLTDENYRLWSAELEDVVTGAREIWIDEFRLLGPAEVVGGFYFKPARLLQVGPATLEVRSGELRIDGRPTLGALDVRLAPTIGLIDLRGPWASAARRISVSGSVSAAVPGADFLRLYLPPDFPVQLDGGGGSLQVDLRLVDGLALPPTAIRLVSETLAIAATSLDVVLGFTAEARVAASAAGPTASGALQVRHAVMMRRGSGVAPPVVDALARFRGLPHDLAGPVEIEHTHLDLSAAVPDLAVLLPLPEAGRPAPVGLHGRAALSAEADLDRDLRGSGRLDARSDRVQAQTSALAVAGAISAKIGFDGADVRRRHLHLLPSYVFADQLTITRDGRAYPGGALRVDLAGGALRSGVPRDFQLALAASFTDLRWLALREDGGKGNGASARAGAASATLFVPRPAAILDGSPEAAAITGSIRVSASGEGRFRDVAIRGNVAATSVIEHLDLGRRTLRLRQTHVVARDVQIDRGHDRSSGWWAAVDLPSLDGSAAGPVSVAAHVGLRSKNGEPFLAALASAGTIPGWVGSVFPMNDLSASADLSGQRGVLDLRLRVLSSSTEVQARLHDLGGPMDGAVFVDTALLSVGVALSHGESHLRVFAGEDWLKRQMATPTSSIVAGARPGQGLGLAAPLAR